MKKAAVFGLHLLGRAPRPAVAASTERPSPDEEAELQLQKYERLARDMDPQELLEQWPLCRVHEGWPAFTKEQELDELMEVARATLGCMASSAFLEKRLCRTSAFLFL